MQVMTYIDPKLAWALRNLHLFPLDVNTADIYLIKRIPGIGILSANKIYAARKYGRVNEQHLIKMGIAFNKAKYFIKNINPNDIKRELTAMQIKEKILTASSTKYRSDFSSQMNLF